MKRVTRNIIAICAGIFVFFVFIVIQQNVSPNMQVIRGLLSGIGAGAAILTWALLRPPINCPECGKALPKFRIPKTIKQALWGGRLCPNCGTEIDRKGRKVSKGGLKLYCPECGEQNPDDAKFCSNYGSQLRTEHEKRLGTMTNKATGGGGKMNKLKIKKIGVKWILSTVSVISAIVGVVIGIFTFFVFPNAAAVGLDFGAKLLAWIIFVVLYTLIMTVGILVVVWLYNILSPSLGCITLNVENENIEE
jgi:hypothetical protein